jgi:serine/threonine protein kinase
MELLRNGVTLEQIMNRNADKDYTPDAAVVLNYMRQFYAGLAASHDAGVLHRDIKGANIMMENETVKILDFGMGVRSSNPNAQLMTTLSIYAPENFDNHHSIESDIFQAGLMFYQLWTNIHPFESSFRNREAAFFDSQLEQARLRQAQMGWRYRSGTEYANFKDNADDCDLLDSILRKSLMYDYNARFRSVHEILNILNAEDGEAPLFEKIRVSYEKKNYEECIYNCQAYTKRKSAPKKKLAQALQTIGDCFIEQDNAAKALPAYIKAFSFAKKEGVYFNDPNAFNHLVEKTALAYKRQGNPEMADMFLKNRRK